MNSRVDDDIQALIEVTAAEAGMPSPVAPPPSSSDDPAVAEEEEKAARAKRKRPSEDEACVLRLLRPSDGRVLISLVQKVKQADQIRFRSSRGSGAHASRAGAVTQTTSASTTASTSYNQKSITEQ
jgi:hypothetical protein